MPKTDPSRGVRVLSRSVAAGISLILASCAAGVVMALVGAFHVAVVVPLSGLLGFVLYRLWPATGPAVQPAPSAIWIAAVVVAACSVALNASVPSEQMIGGRDGATYLATAAWLAADGDLLVEAREPAFAGIPDLDYAGYGFYDARGDGRLTPQFLHALPALEATGRELGGVFLMLRLNAILGGVALLALFGFAQLLVRPWLALVAEGSLAANLVFNYYSRAPFSEILALLFVFGGLWALWTAWESRARTTACLAGLLLGAPVMARIDGLVLVLPLIVVLAYERSRSGASPDTDGLVRSVWIGLLSSLFVAFADLILIDPSYLAQRREEVLLLVAGIIAVVAGDVLLGRRLAAWSRRAMAHRRLVSSAMAALVVLVLGYAYFVRPHIEQAAGSPYLIEFARGSEAFADAASRSFAEQSARWLAWYLGPLGLALGVGGWALLTKRMVEGRARLAVPFLAAFSVVTLLYLWRPSINPDHIWAMRRFLPVVIPGLLILAAFAIDALHDLRGPIVSRARRGVALVAVIAMVGGSLAALVPVAAVNEYRGLAADFERACVAIGPESVVLIVDTPSDPVGARLVQSFRSYCQVPAAFGTTTAKSIGSLAAAWKLQGRRLWLVSSAPSFLESLSGGKATPLVVGTYDVLEITLSERPSRIAKLDVAIYGTLAPLG